MPVSERHINIGEYIKREREREREREIIEERRVTFSSFLLKQPKEVMSLQRNGMSPHGFRLVEKRHRW
jgi:hypothetical protein